MYVLAFFKAGFYLNGLIKSSDEIQRIVNMIHSSLDLQNSVTTIEVCHQKVTNKFLFQLLDQPGLRERKASVGNW